MGPYVTNSVPYLDQFNLTTYGESTSQIGSDVSTSASDGIPKAKMVIGIDIVDYGEPSGGCGQYGSYASQQGLAGVMVWDIHSDEHGGSFPCFTGSRPTSPRHPDQTAAPAPNTDMPGRPGRPENTSTAPTPHRDTHRLRRTLCTGCLAG
jgi:hypothetical protein